MERPGIARVWGVADEFGLVFEKRDGGWTAAVPPDLEDGQYATEIFAEDIYGARAIWSGILYMHNGKCCLHLKMPKYTMWLLPMMQLAPTAVNELRYEGACCYDQ